MIVFIALLSGALMSVQGVFNTQVTKTTGMWVSNAWVQLSAFALCLVAWLIVGRDSVTTLQSRAEIRPFRRRHWGRHYLDRNQKHGTAGTCQSGASHRYFTVDRRLRDRASWLVRRG